MSAISGYISTIQNAVYGEQVRTAIVNALLACYSDVENPDLQSAAFQTAIENAYEDGILDITTVTSFNDMTNQNIIYRYNGTAAGKQKGLYYYSAIASDWVLIGSELQTVSNSSYFTNTKAIYFYTGTQSGMKQNSLYYYNGTSWEPIGNDVETDTTLTESGVPADAKTVGDALRAITGEDEEGSETTTDTINFTEQYYRNDYGEIIVTPSTGNKSTSTILIPITGQTYIKYTGRTGGTCASWFNSNRQFISKTTDASAGTGLVEYNVLQDAPTGAAYVELMSRTTDSTNPPGSTPVVKLSTAITIITRHKIIGDDSADDTAALQWMVDNDEVVNLPAGKTIKITEPVVVDPLKCRAINGNGSRIKIYGDFSAFSIVGDMTAGQTASNPSQDSTHNAGFTIRNIRICNSNNTTSGSNTPPYATNGTGISVAGAFKITIENCYLYMLNKGISISGVNRDLIISNNQIYNNRNNGIIFEQGTDLHQCNIVGNHISYAQSAIKIYNPLSIANIQINSNDIEIASGKPSLGVAADMLCIEIVSGTTFNPTQPILQEIEICGNTIQGHSGSNAIIKMIGDTNRKIRFVSIVGNHISNSNGVGLDLTLCDNFAISGNTFTVISGSALKLTNCSVFAIGSNTADTVGRIANLLTSNSNVKISDNVASGGVAASGVVSRSFIDGNLWTSGASSLLPDSGNIINMNNSHASGQSDTVNEYVTNTAQ